MNTKSKPVVVARPVRVFPEFCYGLIATELLDPSVQEIVPIIIKRGERGYYRTDWVWNREYAEEALTRLNAELGITPDMAARMLGHSMFDSWPKTGVQERLIAALAGLLEQVTGPAMVHGDGRGNDGIKDSLTGAEFNALCNARIHAARTVLAEVCPPAHLPTFPSA